MRSIELDFAVDREAWRLAGRSLRALRWEGDEAAGFEVTTSENIFGTALANIGFYGAKLVDIAGMGGVMMYAGPILAGVAAGGAAVSNEVASLAGEQWLQMSPAAAKYTVGTFVNTAVSATIAAVKVGMKAYGSLKPSEMKFTNFLKRAAAATGFGDFAADTIYGDITLVGEGGVNVLGASKFGDVFIGSAVEDVTIYGTAGINLLSPKSIQITANGTSLGEGFCLNTAPDHFFLMDCDRVILNGGCDGLLALGNDLEICAKNVYLGRADRSPTIKGDGKESISYTGPLENLKSRVTQEIELHADTKLTLAAAEAKTATITLEDKKIVLKAGETSITMEDKKVTIQSAEIFLQTADGKGKLALSDSATNPVELTSSGKMKQSSGDDMTIGLSGQEFLLYSGGIEIKSTLLDAPSPKSLDFGALTISN